MGGAASINLFEPGASRAAERQEIGVVEVKRCTWQRTQAFNGYNPVADAIENEPTTECSRARQSTCAKANKPPGNLRRLECTQIGNIAGGGIHVD